MSRGANAITSLSTIYFVYQASHFFRSRPSTRPDNDKKWKEWGILERNKK